jgi:hypothetical protein
MFFRRLLFRVFGPTRKLPCRYCGKLVRAYNRFEAVCGREDCQTASAADNCW